MPRLVGEAPAPTDDPRDPGPPLTGRPARVLIGCLGAEYEDQDAAAALLTLFETFNLFATRPDLWDRYKAREAAGKVGLAPRTVLLGRRVAEAYGLGRVSYFQWVPVDGASVIVLPHPSGLNRLYNDREIRNQVGLALQEAIGVPR